VNRSGSGISLSVVRHKSMGIGGPGRGPAFRDMCLFVGLGSGTSRPTFNLDLEDYSIESAYLDNLNALDLFSAQRT